MLNKTDKTVMFSVDDASVNGFMADPFYATSVSAGKCAFSSMAWSDTTLEENGITEVEEIEVLFRAYDADDFMGEDFANEVITLSICKARALLPLKIWTLPFPLLMKKQSG